SLPFAPYPCRKTTSCSGVLDFAAMRGPPSVTAILLLSAGFGFVEESCCRAKVKSVQHQDRQPLGGFRLQGLGSRRISAGCSARRRRPVEHRQACPTYMTRVT